MNKAIATINTNVNTEELSLAQRNKWIHFHRFGGRVNFFGVVNKEGEWVDSSVTMSGAMFNAAMDAGIPNEYEHLHDLAVELQKHGYSIVHDSLLEKLFHAGLLK